MAPGVAEYTEAGKDPYRILVSEEAIKNMDPTFRGKPVYVDHVDHVDLKNIQAEADGYVIDSFYNTLDGKHWVQFIVVSDRGHAAISSGWQLSNAYVPKVFNGGGLWHGVQYEREVMAGEYDHLAIVQHPRYEESVIMTSEEFKKYNSDKEAELKALKNSKEKQKETGSMKLNFFKKQKVENATDFEGVSVVLPKSGKEITISQLVEEHDVIVNMQGYANGDHMVKYNDSDEMSVNELVKKYNEMLDESAKSKDMAESKEKEIAEREDGDKGEEQDLEKQKKENAEKDKEGKEDGEEKEKMKNEADAALKLIADKEAAEKAANFEKLKNAPDKSLSEAPKLDLPEDMVARGRALFGK